MHVYLSSVHKGRGIEYILYSGNAEDLINGRNEQYRLEEESVRYTNINFRCYPADPAELDVDYRPE